MKTLNGLALAGALALGLTTAAQAQSLAPQVPNFANPYPANPIATDGSPLPRETYGAGDRLLTGRSAFVGPVGDVVGAGLGTAGSLVGAGVGVAGTAVDTGLGTAGTVVDGTVGR